jgi:hypothetical protein
MSQADLEMRVERLETALAELTARLQLMPSPPRTGEKVPLRQRSGQAPADEGAALAIDDAPWLSLTGFSILIFGGAYLLRALTESSVIPRAAGVALGLAYALVWIYIADRAARAGRTRNASFYAATAAAIAFPLVWETTTQFKYIPPAAGGSCAALIGVILVFVAWRNDTQAIAWIGSIGAIAVTIAIVRPDTILPLMISGSVVGAATLHVAIVKRWKYVGLPAAVLTNSLAAMTVGMPLLRGTIEHPGQIIAALTAFAAVWLAIIFYDAHLSFFDILESALLLFIGIGGAAVISVVSHQHATPLAVAYAVAGIAAYLVAWKRQGMQTWLTSVAVYLIALALLLAVDLQIAAMIAAVLGVASAEAGLAVQSVIWIAGAAIIGGPFATLCAFLATIRTRTATSQVLLLTISVFSLFLIAGHGQSPLIRTCILAAIAAILALASRFAPAAGTVARIVLVGGGLKLLAEDIRLERAAILVISFASYGLAMLTVARCVRRHTSDISTSR